MFKREIRYEVIKIKHLTAEQHASLREFMEGAGIPTVQCVVVEADWPEYEPVWKMIEDRMEGRTDAV